jgi:hypothetical protein
MGKLNNAGMRTARKTARRWFCGSGARHFLPLRGPGLPVSRAEELAILAAAEPFIARRFNRLSGQLSLGLMLAVALPLLSIWLGSGKGGAAPSLSLVATAIFSLGGVLMLAAGWRYERAVLDLRDAVALALRERAGGAPAALRMPEGRGPDIRKLGLAAFCLTGLFLLWPLGAVLWGGYGAWSEASAWPLDAAAGLACGIVLGIMAFLALWTLWLGRASAAPEDGPC